jgi:hypothetical protein
MATSQLPATMEEFQARIDATTGGPSTVDDQCRTWDGRVLNSKQAVLAFLQELADARADGRQIGPPLDA